MSGNIWAALRIALSMMDQPELFQAANIGDLDLLMRAFNLDIWEMGGCDDSTSPLQLLLSFYPTAKSPKCTRPKRLDLMLETKVWIFIYVKINCCPQSSYIIYFLPKYLGAAPRTGSTKCLKWLLCDGFALQFVISLKSTRTGKDCMSNALENTSIKNWLIRWNRA